MSPGTPAAAPADGAAGGGAGGEGGHDGLEVRLTWLGHSTVVLDVRTGARATRLVTDPLLRRHAGLLRRRGGIPADVWRGSDAVLLSHAHHDHAEPASLRMLGPVPVLTAPETARWLRGRGIEGRGLGDDEWFEVAPGVDVRLVPAVHGDRPMPHRPNAANGHLVRVRWGGRTCVVWALGDTEAYAAMRETAGLAGAPVDVALVPVGGWGPRLSGGHLGPREAAQVCSEAGARAAVPVHWGTLHAPGGRWLPPGWMDAAGLAFGVETAARAPGCRPVVLPVGGSWTVPVA
ncbi:MBL fold metallo-hydrolase [Cellulomonas sp. PhB143]|uniref:MBL fold metallo-hydrolase n=1 Tax=Cellulomonas sp. PhB143 TaxID=2485186 RepID=UPI000F47C7CE|nr:MBL fold metallo-hydrolase [Cellulomonas sp. PhB143]ROS77169.1 L-ascorbate metabolism protein UlaG (beta-lactamase superfamily) [Cellulomonas sp. PhB143]